MLDNYEGGWFDSIKHWGSEHRGWVGVAASIVAIGFATSTWLDRRSEREVKQAKFDAEERELQAPPTDWYEASVSVPDFVTGEDPYVMYIQNVKREFLADWAATVLRVIEFEGDGYRGNLEYVCAGSGRNDYEITDGKQNYPMSLSYYVFPKEFCKFTVGKYRIKTKWVMEDRGGRVKVLRHLTEPFTVVDEDDGPR